MIKFRQVRILQNKSWQSVLSHQSPSGEAFSIYERDILKVFLREITVDDFMDSIAAAIVP